MFKTYTITNMLEVYNNIVSFLVSSGFDIVAYDVALKGSQTKSAIFKDKQHNDLIMFAYDGTVSMTVFTNLDNTKPWDEQENVLSNDSTPFYLPLSMPALANASDAENGVEMQCVSNNNNFIVSLIDTTYVRQTNSLVFGELQMYTDSDIAGDMIVGNTNGNSINFAIRVTIDDSGKSWVSSNSTRKLEMTFTTREPAVPTYKCLFNTQLLQGRSVNTLNGASLIMPLIFYVQRDPLVLNTYSAVGYSDIINYVNMFNMSSGHVDKSNVPINGAIYNCYYANRRRQNEGFPGIAFKQG